MQCSSERTAQEANQLHLMADTVHQTHQDTLHVQLTGYTLKKILIARVRDVGGVSHDVMYMAGSKAGMEQAKVSCLWRCPDRKIPLCIGE